MSLSLLKDNLKLYVPDISFALILLILSVIFLNLTGLSGLVQPTPEQLTQIIKQDLVKIAIITGIFILMLFLILIQVSSTKLTMIKNIIQKKKTTIKEAFDESKIYYTKILSIKLLVLLLFLIPLFIVVVLNFLIKISIIKIILFTSLTLIWLFITVLLIYKYPVLFLSKTKEPINVLKESYKSVLKNKLFTLLTILTIVLMFIVSLIITFIFNLLYIQGITSFAMIFNQIIAILLLFIQITISITISIFLFLSFKELSS